MVCARFFILFYFQFHYTVSMSWSQILTHNSVWTRSKMGGFGEVVKLNSFFFRLVSSDVSIVCESVTNKIACYNCEWRQQRAAPAQPHPSTWNGTWQTISGDKQHGSWKSKALAKYPIQSTITCTYKTPS